MHARQENMLMHYE